MGETETTMEKLNNFIYDHSFTVLFLCMSLFYCIVMIIGLILKYTTKIDVAGDNLYSSHIFSAISMLFSILGGLLLVGVNDTYNAASDAVTKEAQYLINLFKNVGLLGEPVATKIRKHLYNYAINVAEKEYSDMELGKEPKAGWLSLQKAFAELINFKPEGPQETFALNNTITMYDNLTMSRKDRILIAQSSLSNLLYIIMISMSIFMVLILCFFEIKSLSYHIFMLILIIINVSLLISIIKYLDKPFRGIGLTLDKTAIEYTINRMRAINKIDLIRTTD